MTELKKIKRETLYSGRIFDVIVDQVEYPSGNRSVREIAHHPGGAVAVPIMDDGSVLLIAQFRYPLGQRIYELPAGKLGPGEDPMVAARRELEEETGWVAGEMELLSSTYTTPGFCDEILHIFLATRLRESSTGHRREEGELTMTLHRVMMSDAIGMIDSGEIQDAKTIIGLLMVERRRRGPI